MKNEPLLPSAQGQDRHQTIKRWERIVQRSAWRRRREENEAPPLPCLWRSDIHSKPETRQARLIALFEGELALVRFLEPTDLRLLRCGIPWNVWHPWILKAWLRGAIVPQPFILLKRISSKLIEEALHWPASLQMEFFIKLRKTGLLSSLPKLDASNISQWMHWDEVRPSFMDFKESGIAEL